VIGHNVERKGKTLVPSLPEGERIHLHEADDEREEAAHACGIIERLRRQDSECRVAVLLRTHAQTRAFEEELVRRNVLIRSWAGSVSTSGARSRTLWRTCGLCTNATTTRAFFAR
jgi:DNA helicase-2/ATP-dependent DNA helicase PcrA